jgi:hypothetical protein
MVFLLVVFAAFAVIHYHSAACRFTTEENTIIRIDQYAAIHLYFTKQVLSSCGIRTIRLDRKTSS